MQTQVWNSLEDFIDSERRLILAERTEWTAENELENLIEMGEIDRVKKVIERIQEKLT